MEIKKDQIQCRYRKIWFQGLLFPLETSILNRFSLKETKHTHTHRRATLGKGNMIKLLRRSFTHTDATGGREATSLDVSGMKSSAFVQFLENLEEEKKDD